MACPLMGIVKGVLQDPGRAAGGEWLQASGGVQGLRIALGLDPRWAKRKEAPGTAGRIMAVGTLSAGGVSRGRDVLNGGTEGHILISGDLQDGWLRWGEEKARGHLKHVEG